MAFLQKKSEHQHKFAPSKLLILIITFTISFCLILNQYDNRYTALGSQAINGIISLSEDSLSRYPVRFLVREWEYYPSVLLSPNELAAGAEGFYRQYVDIGRRLGSDAGGLNAQARGQGTYRLILSLPEGNFTYSIQMPAVSSAYKLYIGDALFLEMGEPGADQYQEAVQEQLVTFRGAGYVQILLAVSDQTAFFSGMARPPAFGLSLSLNRQLLIRNLLAFTALLLAAMVMGISIFLAFRAREALDLLQIPFFFCITVFLGTPLLQIFVSMPTQPWELMENICYYALFPLFIWLCSVCFHWNGQLALTMKLLTTGAFSTMAAAFLLSPFLAEVRSLRFIDGLSCAVNAALVICLAVNGWHALREAKQYAFILGVSSLVLSGTLAAQLLLPRFAPILGMSFPACGFFFCVLLFNLKKWYDLSQSYRLRLEYEENERQTARMLTIQQAHFSRLREKIDEADRLRHDIRQHLRVIQTLLDQGEYEEIRTYLVKYTQIQALSTKAIRFCANRTADALLQYYYKRALDTDVELHFEGIIPILEDEQEVDLCTLLGNLLENALEAVQKQVGKPKFIQLKAKMVGNKLVLRLQNSCSGEPRTADEHLYSSKHGGVGIGTTSVRIITQRYGGFANFQQEESRFIAEIFLPLSLPVADGKPEHNLL